MLKAFKNLFSGEEDTSSESEMDELHLAAAVLMVEAASLDGDTHDVESDVAKYLLGRHFELSEEEAHELFEMATDHHADSVHMHRFTKTIKDRYSEEERIEVIELLWEVVYADGELHDYESNLLRRIGGLLYVSDRDRGEARKRVLNRLGAEQ